MKVSSRTAIAHLPTLPFSHHCRLLLRPLLMPSNSEISSLHTLHTLPTTSIIPPPQTATIRSDHKLHEHIGNKYNVIKHEDSRKQNVVTSTLVQNAESLPKRLLAIDLKASDKSSSSSSSFGNSSNASSFEMLESDDSDESFASLDTPV
jgi:hypothetical protein